MSVVEWLPAPDSLWEAMSHPTIVKKTGKFCRRPGKQILVDWLQLKVANLDFNMLDMHTKD